MTFDHEVAVEEAAAAELRGDWATALERHRSVPMFAESPHGAMLQVLADLGDDAPRWLVNRFLTMMAHRLETYGQPRRSSRVLQHVVPRLYPHGIPFEAMGCDHVEQVLPQIHGRDWVVRQVDVFDLGGLTELIGSGTAYGASLRGVYVMDWATAPMGGYRIVDADGEVMTVADALTGETIELRDLGLTAHHPVGTHVLGRVVPTEDDGPEWLFDWQPLPVDARIAREVARRPEQWLDVIAARTASRALPAGFSHVAASSLSADLPRHSWTSLLGHPLGEELPRPPSTMVAEALNRALQRASESDDVSPDRHVLSELLLDELVDERLVARFATAAYGEGWRALAGVVRPEARRRCETALWLIDAATGDTGAHEDLAG